MNHFVKNKSPIETKHGAKIILPNVRYIYQLAPSLADYGDQHDRCKLNKKVFQCSYLYILRWKLAGNSTQADDSSRQSFIYNSPFSFPFKLLQDTRFLVTNSYFLSHDFCHRDRVDSSMDQPMSQQLISTPHIT